MIDCALISQAIDRSKKELKTYCSISHRILFALDKVRHLSLLIYDLCNTYYIKYSILLLMITRKNAYKVLNLISDFLSGSYKPLAPINHNLFISSYLKYCNRILLVKAYSLLAWQLRPLSINVKGDCSQNRCCF